MRPAILVAVFCATRALGAEAPPANVPRGPGAVVELGRIALPDGVNVGGAVISPDARQLTTTGADHRLRTWAVPPDRSGLLRTMELDGGEVTEMAYSRDGTWIGAATSKGTVGVFRAGTGESGGRLQTAMAGREARISTLALAPDGSRVAIAPENAPAEVWDVATGRRRAVLTTRFGGTNALEFSPDGRRLATADEDTAVRLYDADGRWVASADEFDLEPFTLAFTPDGRQVAVAGPDKAVTLIDSGTGAVVRRLPKQEDPIIRLVALRGGRGLVTASFKEKSMQVRGPMLAWTLDGAPPRVLAADRPFIGGGATADGRLLLASVEAGAIVIWAVR